MKVEGRLSVWFRARRVLRLCWAYSSRFVRVRLAVALLLVVLGAVVTPLGSVALKMIVDGLSGGVSSSSLALLTGLYVASLWIGRALSEVRGIVYAKAEQRMFTGLSHRFFDHLMRLPLRFHLQRSTGGVNQARENGLQGLQTILHHLTFTVLPALVQFSVMIWIIWRMDQPVVLLIFCGGILSYTAAYTCFVLRATRPALLAANASVAASTLMSDNISAFETVKAFAAEDHVGSRVHEACTTTERRWVRVSCLSCVNGLVLATIFALVLLLSTTAATHEVRRGAMTVGEFVLIATYLLQMMQPLEMFGFAVQGILQGLALLDGMMEIFGEAPETRTHTASRATFGSVEQGVAVPPQPAALEFCGVSVAYVPGRPVLSDISFAVPTGRTLGIVGASGSGKSTLVRVLLRLIEPDSGRIFLDGRPVAAMNLEALRRAVALVPQDTVLFNESLRYNIGFGKLGCSDAEVEQAARLAHLQDFIQALPRGYDTVVGERGIALSGGEKQRVSIARAALKGARLYVFDEATASLDVITEREIVKNLRGLSKSCTTVVIAHRLSTVVHADEILVLSAGRVLERGTHLQLLAQDGRYAALWRVQQGETPLEAATAT